MERWDHEEISGEQFGNTSMQNSYKENNIELIMRGNCLDAELEGSTGNHGMGHGNDRVKMDSILVQHMQAGVGGRGDWVSRL